MKFVGSKLRLKKDILPILHHILEVYKPERYIEPFVGGANVIDSIEYDHKIGYDNNEYLIAMWKALQNGWQMPEYIDREQYNDIKDNKQDYPKELVSIAGFVATYNAKWFDGYAGITETKTGKIRNYYDEGKRNIERQLPSVMDTVFIHSDYKDVEVNNALIYCDPPYKTKRTRKDLYGDEFDHEEYFDWVREMSKDNIVICSEYSMPDDFICIFEKGMNVHFDNRNLKERVERLFVHESLLTDCPKCDNKLIYTPLEQYNSQCLECDEDFGYMYIKDII